MEEPFGVGLQPLARDGSGGSNGGFYGNKTSLWSPKNAVKPKKIGTHHQKIASTIILIKKY